MPIIKSAIKRVRQTKRRTVRNRITKDNFKKLIKDFLALVDQKKLEEAGHLYPQVQKAIDMAVKKNVLHANNGARKKSSLAKMIRDAKVSGIKASVSKKTSVTKPKTTEVKKETPTKKPASKKAPAKKK